MKKYEESLKEVAAIKTKEYFHNLMGGGNGDVTWNDAGLALSIVYDIPIIKVQKDLTEMIERGRKELNKHWIEAVHGTYDFNTN